MNARRISEASGFLSTLLAAVACSSSAPTERPSLGANASPQRDGAVIAVTDAGSDSRATSAHGDARVESGGATFGDASTPGADSGGTGVTDSGTTGNVDTGPGGGDTGVSDSGTTGHVDTGPGADAASNLDSGGSGDAKDSAVGMDGSAPDSAVAAETSLLESPNRPSLPFECMGAPLTKAQMIALFGAGVSDMDVSSDGVDDVNFRGAAKTTVYTQTCTGPTGCSVYNPTADPSAEVTLVLQVDATGELTAEFVDSVGNGEGDSGVVAITSGDFLLTPTYTPNPPASAPDVVHVLITQPPTGGACVSLTYSASENAAGGSFTVTQATITPSVGASFPESMQPPFTSSTLCTAASGSNSVIASAWFSPGASTAAFAPNMTKTEGYYRQCHPITGCSAWSAGLGGEELSGAIDTPLVPLADALLVQGSGFAVQLASYNTYVPGNAPHSMPTSLAPLTGGVFSGALTSDPGMTFAEIVGATCMSSLVVATVSAANSSLFRNGPGVTAEIQARTMATP
jgi:hypothetical protein